MFEIDYERPSTVDAAVEALKRTGGRPLAGGQTLVAAMKTRLSAPGFLVDLGGIPELRGIRSTGSSIVIGAMTRHAEVAVSQEVLQAIPALARLAGGIGDRQVRNMGTIGGRRLRCRDGSGRARRRDRRCLRGVSGHGHRAGAGGVIHPGGGKKGDRVCRRLVQRHPCKC